MSYSIQQLGRYDTRVYIWRAAAYSLLYISHIAITITYETYGFVIIILFFHCWNPNAWGE